MSATSNEAHNRVERSVVLVGFIEWAVAVGAAFTVTINLAFGFGENDVAMARLLLWHVAHLIIGAYLLTLVCARDAFAPRALIVAALIALALDTLGLVLAFSLLLSIFPSTSIFVYLYIAFHLAFAALAVALVFYAARAALTRDDDADVDRASSAATVGFVESTHRVASSLASTFVLPASSSERAGTLRQRR